VIQLQDLEMEQGLELLQDLEREWETEQLQGLEMERGMKLEHVFLAKMVSFLFSEPSFFRKNGFFFFLGTSWERLTIVKKALRKQVLNASKAFRNMNWNIFPT